VTVAPQDRLQAPETPQVPGDAGGCDRWRLVEERSVCANTAAAGGNASLMAIG
jgi:delta 1-pyrroline-5-carboxylate dehydrogenase